MNSRSGRCQVGIIFQGDQRSTSFPGSLQWRKSHWIRPRRSDFPVQELTEGDLSFFLEFYSCCAIMPCFNWASLYWPLICRCWQLNREFPIKCAVDTCSEWMMSSDQEDAPIRLVEHVSISFKNNDVIPKSAKYLSDHSTRCLSHVYPSYLRPDAYLP